MAFPDSRWGSNIDEQDMVIKNTNVLLQLCLTYRGLLKTVRTGESCLFAQFFHVFNVYLYVSRKYKYAIELMKWFAR